MSTSPRDSLFGRLVAALTPRSVRDEHAERKAATHAQILDSRRARSDASDYRAAVATRITQLDLDIQRHDDRAR